MPKERFYIIMDYSLFDHLISYYFYFFIFLFDFFFFTFSLYDRQALISLSFIFLLPDPPALFTPLNSLFYLIGVKSFFLFLTREICLLFHWVLQGEICLLFHPVKYPDISRSRRDLTGWTGLLFYLSLWSFTFLSLVFLSFSF